MDKNDNVFRYHNASFIDTLFISPVLYNLVVIHICKCKQNHFHTDWITLHPISASVTFTMTCNEPPTTALASPVSSTPLTERIPWAGDRTTTNPPVRTPPHLTRPSSRPGNPVSTVSSQQHVEPVATTPTPRPSSSITPSSATQTHTEQDLSTELPLDGVLTTLEADPNTPGNAMLGDGAHTVVDRPWKIGNHAN